jgi:hypothetical protein
MLFGMLCIAMQSYTRNNDMPPEYQATAPATMDLYRVRMAQCLVITDLTKPVGKTLHEIDSTPSPIFNASFEERTLI